MMGEKAKRIRALYGLEGEWLEHCLRDVALVRATIRSLLRDRPGMDEVDILRELEATEPDDYEGPGRAWIGVDVLFSMVLDGEIGCFSGDYLVAMIAPLA